MNRTLVRSGVISGHAFLIPPNNKPKIFEPWWPVALLVATKNGVAELFCCQTLGCKTQNAVRFLCGHFVLFWGGSGWGTLRRLLGNQPVLCVGSTASIDRLLSNAMHAHTNNKSILPNCFPLFQFQICTATANNNLKRPARKNKIEEFTFGVGW